MPGEGSQQSTEDGHHEQPRQEPHQWPADEAALVPGVDEQDRHGDVLQQAEADGDQAAGGGAGDRALRFGAEGRDADDHDREEAEPQREPGRQFDPLARPVLADQRENHQRRGDQEDEHAEPERPPDRIAEHGDGQQPPLAVRRPVFRGRSLRGWGGCDLGRRHCSVGAGSVQAVEKAAAAGLIRRESFAGSKGESKCIGDS